MKEFITIDNKLYLVSKEDADKLDDTLHNEDLQDELMKEIEKKYKPKQKRIQIYNY